MSAVIALRVKETRRRLGMPIGALAQRAELSKGMLSKIENAQASPSLATLVRLAEALDVPVTSFFRGFGEEREAVLVKAGQGAQVARQGDRIGHEYRQLGTMRGQHRRMQPQLIILTEQAEVFPLFQHPGTELIYMIEGEMTYGHGRTTYELGPGDALQFDGEAAHGPIALVTLPIRFLSVIATGVVHDTD